MVAFWHGSECSDDERREQLYAGDVHVFPPSKATLALCDFARQLVEEAFDGKDPRTAQHEMAIDDYVALLSGLKPSSSITRGRRNSYGTSSMNAVATSTTPTLTSRDCGRRQATAI